MSDNQGQPSFLKQVGEGLERRAARRLKILGGLLFVLLLLSLVTKYFGYFLALCGLALVGLVANQIWRSYKLRRALKNLDGELQASRQDRA